MTINNTQARLREIGIRRVMGASVGQVFYLLGREIGFPVLVSIAVGLPAAWFLNQAWLQEFPYRVNPGLTVFALGVGLIIVVAAVIVIPIVLRASRINPAQVIRYE